MSEAKRDLAADKALCDAATPGEWYWSLNPKSRSVSLEASGRRHWRETVMGFKRWGMSGATATLRTSIADEFHELRSLHAYGQPIPGREHHADWAQQIDHPDARFIAESRLALPHWIGRAERLEQEVRALRNVIHGIGVHLLGERPNVALHMLRKHLDAEARGA